GSSVHVLPGMEVESREGVHLLALFDEIGALNRWQDAVYSALPPLQNDARLFGTQLVVDADGTLISVNQRLLATAAALSVEEVVRGVGLLGGLCIPAHVDRPSNGLLGVLGMVPDGLGVPALEVSRNLSPQQAAQRFPQLKEITLVRSSDAHALEDVGKATTTFLIDELSVLEVSMACRGERGRLVA
ncbi:MAG TPA: PHP-associated domain-containing protein, partial [Chloroflexota bacterium]